MKPQTFAWLLALIFPFSVPFAATKSEKIREIIAVHISEATLEELRLENVEETRLLMFKQAGEKAKDPLMARLLERAVSKYDAYSRELFDWKSRELEMVRFYEEHFSDAQIEAIWAFYRSDAGKALLEAQPVLLSRLQKATFHTESERRSRIDRIMKETIAEIEKELRSEKSSPPKLELPPLKVDPPTISPPNLKKG